MRKNNHKINVDLIIIIFLLIPFICSALAYKNCMLLLLAMILMKLYGEQKIS